MSKDKPSADKFIHCYLLNGQNAKQAAIDAGYSARTADSQASRLLKSVKVLTAIKEAQKVEQTAFIWSKAKKLQTLQEIVTKSLRPIVDQQGNQRMENAASAVSALKEHNLMQGDNEPTVTNIITPEAIQFTVVRAKNASPAD